MSGAAWPALPFRVFMTSTAFPQQRLSLASFVRAGIAAVAILITVWLQMLPASATFFLSDEWLRDRIVHLRASSALEDRVLVVDIDEASLAAVGPWPWPRERLATLLENLIANYSVRGVALDLVLPGIADADGDARLSVLTQNAPLVMAAAFDYDLTRTVPLRVGNIAGGVEAPAAEAGTKAAGFISNHAGLTTQHIGNIGFIPDGDGVIRHLPLQTRFENRLYPTLSLALMQCCSGGQMPLLAAGDGTLWRIPYQRQWESYTVVSAVDILQARLPAGGLSGRLALLGSSSLGLADRVATPLAASTSGLLVHAAALTSMLDAEAGTAPAPWSGCLIAIACTVMLVALTSYTFPRLSALSNVFLLAVAGLMWLVIAWFIAGHDAAVMLSAPLVSILFLLAVAVPFDWQLTQLKSRRLLGTLNQYVAQSVVTELLRSNLTDPLSPVQREVTTLIADMEGYTRHVAALPVEEAARLTRDFLDCLTRPVLAQSGTLDKYTGDGLVAFWGAPLPNADHADLALEAAREIVLEVRRFSQVRESAGMPRLRVRIGIESGIAMAGDFGSAFRSIYTAVGDSVNVASRLEQLARDFPYDVIVGPGTAAKATRHALRRLGDVVLRGKDSATALFALEVDS